jgi:hypothetical protein
MMMKKLITAISMAAVCAFLLAATPAARAMSVDDILQLCNSGFTADRIARIVEATGMDKPLEASDWARLKSDGCGDEVVDALLDVLAPATQTEVSDDAIDDADNVNVYVRSDWGWNGWYGSLFWGGPSDPWWGSRVGWYDPWWGWNSYYSNWYWNDPWWGYPYHHRYYGYAYCDPYFYHGNHYTGGYYFGGMHYRQKAMRQAGGGAKTYRYASLKSTPSVQNATYASARVKPYRSGSVVRGMDETGLVAYRKSTTSVVRDGSTTQVRRKSASYGRSTTPSTGAVTKGRTTTTGTTGTTSTYAKRKTMVSTGSGSTTTSVSRSKTKVKSPTTTGGSTTTTVKRKSSGGATSTGNTSTGTSTSKAKPKGSSSSSYSPPKHQGSGSVSTSSSSARGSSSSGAQARPKKH